MATVLEKQPEPHKMGALDLEWDGETVLCICGATRIPVRYDGIVLMVKSYRERK